MSRPAQLSADAPIHVLVGLIQDTQGRYLINRRKSGTHMAGRWEFPGGKRIQGEQRRDTLCRELAEELGIEVDNAEPLIEIVHDYTDRCVKLDIWLVLSYTGQPHAREGQPLRWVSLDELASVGLLPADRPIVEELLSRA